MSIRTLLLAGASNYLSTLNKVDIFGDGSGKALYMLEDNALDESGNYNGTATNVTYASGRFGRCGVFNGSSSYVTIPEFVLPSTSTSFSLWMNKVGTGLGTAELICQLTNYELQLASAPTIKATIRDSSGAYSVADTLISPINGNWYHVVAILDHASSSLKVYVNGSVLASTAWNGTFWNNTQNVSRIGGTSVTIFNGSIDQVRIFNKALTQSEVTALYNEI